MSKTAACAIGAFALTCLGPGSAAAQSAPAPAGLDGLSSTASAMVQAPGSGAPAQLTDRTTIIAATNDELILRYGSLAELPDHTVLRRTLSDVVIPLRAIAIKRVEAATQFSCIDRAAPCMAWAHLDFYSRDGADFGKAGTSLDYTITMDPELTERLFRALCKVARCE